MNTCKWLQQNINRFLDNDLSGNDAAKAAHHLTECGECRLLQDEMDAVRGLVRSAILPESGDLARERVFARLEQAVAGKRGMSRRRFHWPAITWQPAIATVAAAAVVIGLVALLPGRTPVDKIGIESPNAVEMTRFFNLHDAQSADLVAGDPITHRDVRAEAQAALLQDAELRVQDGL